MSDPRWQRMWELFHEALQRPEAERDPFLAEACADDDELHAEVVRLLASHDRTGGILSESSAHLALDTASVEDPLIGRRIGPYRIVEVLGEGGMGVVYAAEQEEPVRRRVALKLIRAGMDTHQVVARFQAERQALAMMSHPAIARVFDAGATEAGRPYFVMELVEGVPITEFCDAERLSTRERLDLLLEVCGGVRHAHQRGLIHRDLKPANVLVTTEGGRAIPKIIDFGVAKAMGQPLTEKTLFTAMGAWIGTPEYMSPEQAEMQNAGIDTRTDVYSLGVLLYELLVGALPFDARELRSAAFDEVRRKIREDEPPKPSTRVSTLGEEPSVEAADRRRTDPAALRRQLSGDLDWIAMRALEKDPDRRYGSVGELADDLGRHLRDEPVLAGPPTASYRTVKFFRRHTVGASFAALAVLFVIVLAVVMTVQAGRIASERDRATLEAATSQRVSEFLVGLFEVSDPGEARGNSVTAREVLDRGVEEIDESLEGQPEVRARLLHTMGEVYRKLGLYPEARPLLEGALEARRELLGSQHPDTLETLDRLGLLAYDREEFDLAVTYHREALAGRRHVLGETHADTGTSLNNLGIVLKDLARYEEAGLLLEEAVEVRRQALGEEHEKTLVALNNLAQLHLDLGRTEEALRRFEEVLAAQRRTLGDDHPSTLISINEVAVSLIRLGKLEESEALFAEAVAGSLRVLGPDHRETLNTKANLAYAQGQLEKYEQAIAGTLEILEASRRLFGPDSFGTLQTLLDLGSIYFRSGDPFAAEPYWEEALEGSRRRLGEDHPLTLRALSSLGRLYGARQEFERAEEYLRESQRRAERTLGPDNTRTLSAKVALGELLADAGRAGEAETLLESALESARRALAEGHVQRADIGASYGSFLARTGRHREGERELLEAYEIAREAAGPSSPRSRRVADRLAELYEAWERPDQAAEWRAKAAAEE